MMMATSDSSSMTTCLLGRLRFAYAKEA
jgi:hypothetical protein